MADVVNQTPSRLLWEASSHAAINMQRIFVYKYPLLSIAMYSFIQLSELVQCRVNEYSQGSTQQDSNPGSLTQESDALATAPHMYGITRMLSL